MRNAEKVLDDLILQEGKTEQEFHQENLQLEPLLGELEFIESQPIQCFVRALLLRVNEFWVAPSDGDPTSRPADERGVGGLVLHTKRVVRTAELFCDAYGLETEERDIIYAACILHDITKALYLRDSDKEFYYDPMHPYTVGTFLRIVREEDKFYSDESKSSVMYLNEEIVAQIMRLIRCHLGIDSPIPETMPITNADMIVHLADKTASNLEYIWYGPSEG